MRYCTHSCIFILDITIWSGARVATTLHSGMLLVISIRFFLRNDFSSENTEMYFRYDPSLGLAKFEEDCSVARACEPTEGTVCIDGICQCSGSRKFREGKLIRN